MLFRRPTLIEGPACLRALATVARADGAISPTEGAMLRAGADMVGLQVEPDELLPIEPSRVASIVTDPAMRQQLVGALTVMSLIGDDAKQGVSMLHQFAAALDVQAPPVRTADHIAHGHLVTARIDIARRFWALNKAWDRARHQGLGVLVETVRALADCGGNPKLAARYQALGQLPEGTLGREYHDLLRRGGIPLVGEPHAAPETIVYHDMTHVLSGYGMSPPEEVLVASFSAGYRNENPLYYVLFVLCQFHLGIQTAPRVEPVTGWFDPAKALDAVQRGAAMNIDLSGDWEYWPVVEEPVDALRERYGISPRLDEPTPYP